MTKKTRTPMPKVARITVTGRLDSLADLLKQSLFEYSPQRHDELVRRAEQTILKEQAPAKVQKNVQRCLTRNPCFRSEGKELWSLRLDGFKENDGAYRVLQAKGASLKLDAINAELKAANKEEVPAEHKLVTDGRFLRLKDGRWGLVHWAYVEPKPEEKPAPAVLAPPGLAEVIKEAAAAASAAPKPRPAHHDDFWEKLFPLQPKVAPAPPAVAALPPVAAPPPEPALQEIAASAEVAVLTLEGEAKKPAPSRELSLIEGGRARDNGEMERLKQENEDLRKEKGSLLADLENMHKRKEELRQELVQVEEQLVSLRVERDSLKKRSGHLETRLMQLQGTLNKTVSEAQSDQQRLKQQLREQEYKLQTALIANEDLERVVADLQRERQDLKRQLALWPVRLALRLCSLLGLIYLDKPPRVKPLGR